MIFDLSVAPSSVKDDELEYDAKSHMWLLSASKTKSMFRYLGDEDADEKRKDISDSVYYEAQYVLSHTLNWPFAEWAVDCTNGGREAIKRCLLSQARADAVSGLGSLAYQTPIDKGQVIGKKTLEQNAVQFKVDGILSSLMLDTSEGPIPVFRMVDLGVRMPASRYSDYGY